MADRENLGEGKLEIQKLEYLKNKNSFLDEMKRHIITFIII